MPKDFSKTIKYNDSLVEFHFKFNGTENIPIYKVQTEDRSLDFLMVKNEERFEVIPLLIAAEAIKTIEDELNEAICKNVND
jgi:hypothetical protein